MHKYGFLSWDRPGGISPAGAVPIWLCGRMVRRLGLSLKLTSAAGGWGWREMTKPTNHWLIRSHIYYPSSGDTNPADTE